MDVKIQKRVYASQKVGVGEFMVIEKWQKKPASKFNAETQKWVHDTSKMEMWITKYIAVKGECFS